MDYMSENVVTRFDRIVTCIGWGALAFTFFIDLFKRANKEKKLKGLGALEFILGSTVTICLLLQPPLDARLDHFKEIETQAEEDQISSLKSQLQQTQSELAQLTKDRTISNAEEKSIIASLKDVPAHPIEVGVSSYNGEQGRFARRVREILDNAGFGTYGAAISVPPAIPMSEGTGIEIASPTLKSRNNADIQIWLCVSNTNSPPPELLSLGKRLIRAFRLAKNVSSEGVICQSGGRDDLCVIISEKK